jgi:hypothetical protein
MLRFSTGDLLRSWGRIQDKALVEPVTVTSNGRDRMVLLSAEEYHRLKRRDREVLGIGDFKETELLAIQGSKPSEASMDFNDEMEN